VVDCINRPPYCRTVTLGVPSTPAHYYRSHTTSLAWYRLNEAERARLGSIVASTCIKCGRTQGILLSGLVDGRSENDTYVRPRHSPTETSTPCQQTSQLKSKTPLRGAITTRIIATAMTNKVNEKIPPSASFVSILNRIRQSTFVESKMTGTRISTQRPKS
jgi:hypothetical protein